MKKLYLTRVKVIGSYFVLRNWRFGHSKYFITKFKIDDSRSETVSITDVDCEIMVCNEIKSENDILFAQRLVSDYEVSFLKRTFLFDDYTVLKKVTLKKLNKLLRRETMSTEYHDQMMGQKETKEAYMLQLRIDKVLEEFDDVSRGKLLKMRFETSIFYNTEHKYFSLNSEVNVISIDLVDKLMEELWFDNKVLYHK